MRLAAAVVVALAFPSAASGALTARLTASPNPAPVGRSVSISVLPLWPFLREDGTCCRYEPADVTYRFRLQLLGPRGAVLVVEPRRVERFRYVASVALRRVGRWEVRLANFYASPRDERLAIRYHGPRLVVRAR